MGVNLHISMHPPNTKTLWPLS